MGRYLGPKVKLSRRVGVPIADIPKHTAKELSLPGMHGYRGRRNTEYGVRLTEKQKLRFHYGMLEKQFRKFLDIAKRSKALAGRNRQHGVNQQERCSGDADRADHEEL